VRVVSRVGHGTVRHLERLQCGDGFLQAQPGGMHRHGRRVDGRPSAQVRSSGPRRGPDHGVQEQLGAGSGVPHVDTEHDDATRFVVDHGCDDRSRLTRPTGLAHRGGSGGAHGQGRDQGQRGRRRPREQVLDGGADDGAGSAGTISRGSGFANTGWTSTPGVASAEAAPGSVPRRTTTPAPSRRDPLTSADTMVTRTSASCGASTSTSPCATTWSRSAGSPPRNGSGRYTVGKSVIGRPRSHVGGLPGDTWTARYGPPPAGSPITRRCWSAT